MKLLQSFVIACSMYSKVPMPKIEWNKKNMKYALCFFPVIGVLIGITIWSIGSLLIQWNVSSLLFPVCMTLIPLFITGGIHMDGFLDTVDALSSYGEQEKKLEILKDPHAGAFAIIGAFGYFLWSMGIWSEVQTSPNYQSILLVVGVGFVLSRSLSGLSVVSFHLAKNSGLAAAFQDGAHRKRVGIIMVLYIMLSSGVMLIIDWRQGVMAMIAGGLAFGYHRHVSYKKFGGITGDLAGYFLQLCELLIITCVVIGTRLWS